MGYGYAYDPPGSSCTGGPTPGAIALRDACRARWPELTDLGIYNCRRVRGGTSLSLHAEGRAIDLGTPNKAAIAQGHECADWLTSSADALGVQEVIWHRRRWTSMRRAWAPYSGADPHTGHVHVALCWAAARGGPALADAGGRAPSGPSPFDKLTSGALWVRVLLAVVGVALLALAAAVIVRGL